MAGGSQEVQGPGVQGGPQVQHAGLSNPLEEHTQRKHEGSCYKEV